MRVADERPDWLEVVLRAMTAPTQVFELSSTATAGDLLRLERAGLLAGLGTPEAWLLYGKYLGDARANRCLQAWLQDQMMRWSVTDGWRLAPHSERLRQLAALVLEDAYRGAPRPGYRERARRFVVAPATWLRTWEDRYAAALAEVLTLEHTLTDTLRRRVQAGRGG